MRRGLERAPCLVSFSGGQDSSLVLAAATRAARAAGLPDPVPVTWRSAGVPGNDESAWQEAVVAELGLGDWIKLQTGDDLDFVGPVAADAVRRHGPMYPPNAHLHGPLAAQARGGTLLTGLGGDQIFGLWRWSRAADVLARRDRPVPADAARVALAWSPAALRAGVERRRAVPSPALPWLTSSAASALARRLAADAAAEPASWRARVAWQAERRWLQLGLAYMERLAADHDCVLEHPLLDPAVLAAVGTAGGRLGFGSREAALAALFPALRPAAVAQRRSKVHFNDVFARGPSRDAAAAWDGSGLDPAVVDLAALQRVWRERVPIRSALMLQQITLKGRAAAITQR